MSLHTKLLNTLSLHWLRIGCFLVVALVFVGQQVRSATIHNTAGEMIAAVMQGLVITVMTFYGIDRLTNWNTLVNVLALCFSTLAYTYAVMYFITTNSHLDTGVILLNWRDVLHFGSLAVVSSLLDGWQKMLFGIVAVLGAVYIWKFRMSLLELKFHKKQFTLGIFAIATVIGLTVGPMRISDDSTDEITLMLNSVRNAYVVKQNMSLTPDQRQEFIRAHTQLNSKLTVGKSNKEAQPHVFLILMESFNPNFVRTRATNGKFYTPFFNSLISQGMYFENFYGNSVQTAKGQFASLCGYLPLVTAKAMGDVPLDGLDCLPELMRSAGYETAYIQGYANLNFDNTGSFMSRIGFNEVIAMDTDIVGSNSYENHAWGWGIPDTFTYQEALKRAKTINDSGKSAFITISTISHHMPFTQVPENKRNIFPNQSSRKEAFANSISLADHYLKSFFEELNKANDLKNNSIIIITGDHGFPAGEHGNYFNQIGAYNENFKIPLLVFGAHEFIKKGVVESSTFSQVAIKPTVLHLAGIQKSGFYYSSSLFDLPPPATYLIQPYDGIRLAVIRGHMKFEYSVRDDVEKLFDLQKDPTESVDLLRDTVNTSQYSSDAELRQLREDIKVIYRNEGLIRSR